MDKPPEKPFKLLFKQEECLIIDKGKINHPRQLILIGGGASIVSGLKMNLWKHLEEKYCIGLNYSYLYYPNPTIQCFADFLFYQDEINKLKSLPLIIGKWHRALEEVKHPNTILLQANDKEYNRNLKEGVYKSSLCGLFGLSLAIYLLDIGEIFLLGYDQGNLDGSKDEKGRRITHFYQKDLIHRGSGKINYYNTEGRADKDFSCYAEEKRVKIYNVSPLSRIDTFIKIDYSQFFSMLNDNTYDQITLRQIIKNKLKGMLGKHHTKKSKIKMITTLQNIIFI